MLWASKVGVMGSEGTVSAVRRCAAQVSCHTHVKNLQDAKGY